MTPATVASFSHGRLWSLLDMLELKAHAFVGALNTLGELDTIAGKDPKWLYDDAGRRAFLESNIDELIVHLRVLDLTLAIKKAQSTKALLSVSGVSPETAASTVSSYLRELRERIVQSLEERIIYCVPAERVVYIRDNDTIFGKVASDAFAGSAYDLSEAAYCLGMVRTTACVFHLMRAMESTVVALGKKLQATVIDKHNVHLEWGLILANIRTKVEAMPKGDERDKWSATVSLLYHVKQAWRNTTMHPKETYTYDEAVGVFNAVRSFLQNAAMHL